MKQYSEDDIEVLGSEPAKDTRKSSWLIVAIAIIAIVAATSLVLAFDRDTTEAIEDESEISSEMPIAPATPAAADLPHEFADSINDVAFSGLMLQGCKASVSFALPGEGEDSVVLALPAADYRGDNGDIVGEFIHDRQLLSRGNRKRGYCYVAPDGTITIGQGDGEACKQSAREAGGTFFRQYALVMDGELQPNALKGKARRRALAFLDGTLVFVMSRDRESIYDFSQALVDYGFSHALYLPGGGSTIIINSDATSLRQEQQHDPNDRVNYIIFKH